MNAFITAFITSLLFPADTPIQAFVALSLLWLIHAILGAALTAPILFLGRKRVGWAKWQWLMLMVPFCLWVLLMASPLPAGRRSLTCLGTPIFISLGMPLLAFVRVAAGRTFSEKLHFASSMAVLSGIVVAATAVQNRI
jgi:hypothetical protein